MVWHKEGIEFIFNLVVYQSSLVFPGLLAFRSLPIYAMKNQRCSMEESQKNGFIKKIFIFIMNG